jgi:hypothetical protein
MFASAQRWIHGNRAMHKATSRHTDLVDTLRECSSSPCWMHEVDPGYLGYWSNEEVIAFLKDLLERERIGTKAFAEIGQVADLRVADLILEAELDQVSTCILLHKEITKRGATVKGSPKRSVDDGRINFSVEQAVAFAMSHQTGLVQTIEAAILNIFDAGLNSHLTKVLRLHRNQIEQLKNLLG